VPETHHRYSDSHSDLTDDYDDNREVEGDDTASPRSPSHQPPPPPRPVLSIADALAVRVKQQPQLPPSSSVAAHRNSDQDEDEGEDNDFNDEPASNETKPVLNIKDALAGMMGKPRPSLSGKSAPVGSSTVREEDNEEVGREAKPTPQKKPAPAPEPEKDDEEEGDDDLFGTNDDPYSLFGNRKSTVNKVNFVLFLLTSFVLTLFR
jgi:type IV secretory pathway VirB10-like protein